MVQGKKSTTAPNIVYIRFIDGIELMPEAVNRIQMVAWRFMVICNCGSIFVKSWKGIVIEENVDDIGINIGINKSTKSSMFSFIKNEVTVTYPKAPTARTCKLRKLPTFSECWKWPWLQKGAKDSRNKWRVRACTRRSIHSNPHPTWQKQEKGIFRFAELKV